jgi:hypothetical protein
VEVACREDFTPSAMQIERGLTDVAVIVRLAWSSKKNITLTKGQIERGLNDESLAIVSAILQRAECFPSREKINELLESSNPWISKVLEERLGVWEAQQLKSDFQVKNTPHRKVL